MGWPAAGLLLARARLAHLRAQIRKRQCVNARTRQQRDLVKLLLGLDGNTGEDAPLGLAELGPEAGALVLVDLAERGRHGGSAEIGLLRGVASGGESRGGGSNNEASGGAAVHLHAHIASGGAETGLPPKDTRVSRNN